MRFQRLRVGGVLSLLHLKMRGLQASIMVTSSDGSSVSVRVRLAFDIWWSPSAVKKVAITTIIVSSIVTALFTLS